MIAALTPTSALAVLYLGVTLLVGLVVHEWAHAFVSVRLGDPSPRLTRRLSFNPRWHVDPFGSYLLPGLLLIPTLFSHLFPLFAYGKPMTLNPWNLRKRDRDSVLVALAGPIASLIVAAAFGALCRVSSAALVARIFSAGLFANTLLAVVNILPIPGLDGARFVAPLLPPRAREVYTNLDQYLPLFILLVFFLFASPILTFTSVVGGGLMDLLGGGACVPLL